MIISKNLKGWLLIAVLLIPFQFDVHANEASVDSEQGIDSSEIMQSHFEGLECVEYCVIGVCIWLICSLYYCEVEVSPKIAHNRPDLVVSTYKHPGEMTYIDAANAYGELVAEAGGSLFGVLDVFDSFDGGNDNTAPNETRNMMKFDLKIKEASIIGNLSTVVSSNYMCESAVTSFQPYFQSEIDSIAWRYGTDRFDPRSYLIGYEEIGDFPSYSFGPLYPRMGQIIETDDYKAATVMAARAMSILKDGGLGHIRYELTNNHVSQEGHEIIESSKPWQPVYPSVQGNCMALGSNNDVTYLETHRTTNQKNAWVYWQRYKCCVDNPGSYVGSVEFPTPLCLDMEGSSGDFGFETGGY